MRRAKAHTASLAGYDAIIGVPTLTAGGAVIDVVHRKVNFTKWNATLDCEIPEELSNPFKGKVRGNRGRKRGNEDNARKGAEADGIVVNGIVMATRGLDQTPTTPTTPTPTMPTPTLATPTLMHTPPLTTPTLTPETAPGTVHSTVPRTVHSTTPGTVHSTTPGTVHDTAPQTTPSTTSQVRRDGDAAYYRSLLLSEFADILVDELPNELPPLWDINH